MCEETTDDKKKLPLKHPDNPFALKGNRCQGFKVGKKGSVIQLAETSFNPDGDDVNYGYIQLISLGNDLVKHLDDLRLGDIVHVDLQGVDAGPHVEGQITWYIHGDAIMAVVEDTDSYERPKPVDLTSNEEDNADENKNNNEEENTSEPGNSDEQAKGRIRLDE